MGVSANRGLQPGVGRVFEVMGLQDGAAPEGNGEVSMRPCPSGTRRSTRPLSTAWAEPGRVKMAETQWTASFDRLAQNAPLFNPLFGRVLFRVGHCSFPFVNGGETGAGLAIAMSPG